jgi:Family of unknown function (DUF6090)
MQDEVTKHTQKIYDTVKNPKQTLGEKIKEILIEIFIIVFAVTLSIWLHSWSEHRHQQNEVKEFLADLKEDLRNDINSMQTAKETLSKNFADFLFLKNLTKSKIDSLFKVKSSFSFHSSIGTTKINNGNYEGFKSSGKIGFIENKGLKKHILKYYQDATPSVLEVENINTSQVLKITDYWAENAGQDIKKTILSPKLKTMIEAFQNTSTSSLEIYQEAITTAKQIIAEIDKQKD